MLKTTTLDKLCTCREIKHFPDYNKERTEEYKYPLKGGGRGFKGYTNFTNCKKNTITIIIRGTCGIVDFITEDFAITKGCVALENISEEVDVGYLYCFLKAREPYIKSLRKGCTIQGIRKTEIEKLVVTYPNLEEQRKIVTIISDFSKVISKSKEEIERLEELNLQMRRTIFKTLLGKANAYKVIDSCQIKEL